MYQHWKDTELDFWVNWDSIPFILWTCLSNYGISKNDLSNEGECSATPSTQQPQNLTAL
jgi:hypothetical protein